MPPFPDFPHCPSRAPITLIAIETQRLTVAGKTSSGRFHAGYDSLLARTTVAKAGFPEIIPARGSEAPSATCATMEFNGHEAASHLRYRLAKRGPFSAEVVMARYRRETGDDDGWSDWIHPCPGYKMACCDCGLVHNMEFRIDDAGQINFRASRNVRSTAQKRRYQKALSDA